MDETEIEFEGDAWKMSYSDGRLSIQEKQNGPYALPQIMYVPAERNFISTIKSPKLLKLSSDSLVEFLTEFENAKGQLWKVQQVVGTSGSVSLGLPINQAEIEYEHSDDTMYIRGDNYRVALTEASSGFQSIVPLYLVSWYLANRVASSEVQEPMSSDELSRFRKGVAEIWANNQLTDEQKRSALSVLSSRFNKTAFLNIVEEPEQNLFPESQRGMLNSLLDFNCRSESSCLILTTHSPYIVNYLSVAIQAAQVNDLLKGNTPYNPELANKLYSIVPEQSMVSGDEVAIYELDESDGTITRLPDFEGIPSDDNFLNRFLKKGNELFDALLEIEQAL